MFPVLLGVVSLVFILLHLVPGDPVDLLLGDNVLPASREALRLELHLDEPLSRQYIHFWQNVFSGHLGDSISQRKPVLELIITRFGATLELAVLALLTATLLSIPTGLWLAKKKDSWIDHGFLTLSLVVVSIPSFCLGPLLVLFFAVYLGWLPVSERGDISSYILPVLTLSIGMSAYLVRLMRASTIEILHEDFITTAHSKGLSLSAIFGKHILKNAALPMVSVLGLQFGALLSGSVIIETIFDWPGLGELLFRAIQSRDYPLVQGCVLGIACSYVLVNTAVDILYQIINPRIRTS